MIIINNQFNPVFLESKKCSSQESSLLMKCLETRKLSGDIFNGTNEL